VGSRHGRIIEAACGNVNEGAGCIPTSGFWLRPGFQFGTRKSFNGVTLGLLHAPRPNFIRNPKYIDPKALAGISRPACGLPEKNGAARFRWPFACNCRKHAAPSANPRSKNIREEHGPKENYARNAPICLGLRSPRD